MSAYSASKAGVEAMCNSLRIELAHHGVAVGTIHPTGSTRRWCARATPSCARSTASARRSRRRSTGPTRSRRRRATSPTGSTGGRAGSAPRGSSAPRTCMRAALTTRAVPARPRRGRPGHRATVRRAGEPSADAGRPRPASGSPLGCREDRRRGRRHDGRGHRRARGRRGTARPSCTTPIRRRSPARRKGRSGSPTSRALAACELVIEAAPEDLEIKRALFGELAGDRRRRLRAGDQHVVAERDRARGRRARPGARRRHALLQPAAEDAPARGRRGRRQLAGRAGDAPERRARRWAST